MNYYTFFYETRSWSSSGQYGEVIYLKLKGKTTVYVYSIHIFLGMPFPSLWYVEDFVHKILPIFTSSIKGDLNDDNRNK